MCISIELPGNADAQVRIPHFESTGLAHDNSRLLRTCSAVSTVHVITWGLGACREQSVQ